MQRTTPKSKKSSTKSEPKAKPAPTSESPTSNLFKRVNPQFTRPRWQYIIDDVLPAGMVSMMGGSSGTGKSKIIAQIMESLKETNKEFLGHPVLIHPPIAYYAVDRPARSFEENFGRMKADLRHVQFFTTTRKFRTGMGIQLARHEQGSLIIIEGIERLVPGGKINDFAAVSDLVSSLNHAAEDYGFTILGTVGQGKAKAGEQYASARDRLFGSTAWARVCESVLSMVDVTKEGDYQKTVCLEIHPRNGAALNYYFYFGPDGCLHLTVNDNIKNDLKALLERLPKKFSTPDAVKIGATKPLENSRATTYRHLIALINAGLIQKTLRGVYIKLAETLDTGSDSLIFP